MQKNPLLGRWRISEMDLWDQGYVDAEGPAHITFGADGFGEFHFGHVHGSMTCEYELAIDEATARFTWEGNDEMDAASGRGWARVGRAGSMSGRIVFHRGDKSGFRARRSTGERGSLSTKK